MKINFEITKAQAVLENNGIVTFALLFVVWINEAGESVDVANERI